MSNTPITNAAKEKLYYFDCHAYGDWDEHYIPIEAVRAEKVESLERELNAAKARAESAEKEAMLQREQRENIAAGWKADDEMFRRVLPALRAENAELRKALESIRALKPVDMEGYSYFSSRMGLEPDEVFEICDAALSATPMNKEQP